MGMGKRKDSFCVFDKICKEDGWRPVYLHECENLYHKPEYFVPILQHHELNIRINDNSFHENGYTYNLCPGTKKTKNLVYETIDNLCKPIVNESDDEKQKRTCGNLLFREAHILKWNRIEEWF